MPILKETRELYVSVWHKDGGSNLPSTNPGIPNREGQCHYSQPDDRLAFSDHSFSLLALIAFFQHFKI